MRACSSCYAALVWALAGAAVVATAAARAHPAWIPITLGGLAAMLAVLRAAAAVRVLRIRASLSGRAIETIEERDMKAWRAFLAANPVTK